MLTAVAAGNVGYPLLDAVAALPRLPARRRHGHPLAGTGDVVLVAEVSSFQLEYTHRFSPDVSCWLNFAPDHLDWHPNLEHYIRAKAKIWAHQAPGSVAVVNADDPVVREPLGHRAAGVRVVTFGAIGTTWAVGPEGVEGPGGLVLEGGGPAPRLPPRPGQYRRRSGRGHGRGRRRAGLPAGRPLDRRRRPTGCNW